MSSEIKFPGHGFLEDTFIVGAYHENIVNNCTKLNI